MFDKILIANRGEIAVRVARTCRELGVRVVAVHSDVDAGARHLALADEAVHLPGAAAAETYLNVEAILAGARETGAEAVHPGYGFLSERADAAEAVTAAGLVWIGPPAGAIRAAGDKVEARRLARSVDVEPVPGTLEAVRDPEAVLAFGQEHGYPVAVKAAGGGGGRGLKVAASAGEVSEAFGSAVREATAYFGYGDVYLERYLERPKHVEVQILAEGPGRATWLGARDCSMQRRHQKLIEETPPPGFRQLVPQMGDAAARVANACGYVNAGTVEFLIDTDAARFYFLEINARLQVEHTITEEVLGVDLVAAQLRIAAGEPSGVEAAPLSARGHSIECRINAEDPRRGFLPGPGRITRYWQPGGPGIRVDSGFGQGDEVPPTYDSLIAKLIAWGEDREQARRRMLRALGEFDIEGVPTTIPAHQMLLQDPSFVDGSYSTRTVEGGALGSLGGGADPVTRGRVAGPSDTDRAAAAVLMVGGRAVRLWNPAIAGSVAAASGAGSGGARGAVLAPMPGTILKLLVAEGDEVAAGDPVAVLEAMKMETQLSATVAGTVSAVEARQGDVVEAGQPILQVSPAGP